MGAVRVDAGPLQPARPRGGARDDPAVPRRGHRHDRVEPAGTRAPRPRLGRRQATARSGNDGFADMLYTPLTEQSDHAIVDAVGAVAEARGVKRAQVALAWLRSKPVVTAPLVGA